MSSGAHDVHCPCLDVHHEQHVHALEEHVIDVQEVAGHDRACLGLPGTDATSATPAAPTGDED
jgi:hypothetical protein